MNIPYKRIDLKQINTFITVCDTKNISTAAETLSISQSSVTQQIKSLERNTNTILFKRTPHGVELTEVGKIFYYRIKDHYNSFDYAISQIENYYKIDKETIHIAVHYPYLVSVLPKIISRIKHIPIKIYNISCKCAEDRMLEGKIDIAIYPVYKRNPKFLYHILSEYRPTLILNKNNKLCETENIRKEDLVSENFITIDKNLIALDGFAKLYEELSFGATISLENGNWDILLSMVEQNLGVALVSDVFINRNNTPNIVYKDMSHIFQKTSYQISIADPLLMELGNVQEFIKAISHDFYQSILSRKF